MERIETGYKNECQKHCFDEVKEKKKRRKGAVRLRMEFAISKGPNDRDTLHKKPIAAALSASL